MTKYTIVAGDTFISIAQKLDLSPEAIQAHNPTIQTRNLQIGQLIHIPNHEACNYPRDSPLTYMIQSGDTFTTIASQHSTTASAIQALNPTLDPTTLQVGQLINTPNPSSSSKPAKAGYTHYSGPSSNFPSLNTWASYDTLWQQNSKLMSYSSTPSEISMIGTAILSSSRASGVDARVIICLILQESGGNVRVKSTSSWEGVHNTGLMQAHNGSSFDESDPKGSIEKMVRDGTMGTKWGDGLVQCLKHQGGDYYRAFREYNSGRLGVNVKDLSDGMGATDDYVEKMANRLLGHTWAGM